MIVETLTISVCDVFISEEVIMENIFMLLAFVGGNTRIEGCD